MSEKCETCYYWVNNGFCYRYPPVYIKGAVLGAVEDWSYPNTRYGDWCGEYKKEG